MPEITWKKFRKFFLTVTIAITGLAIISDLLLFTNLLFITLNLRDMNFNLPTLGSRQTEYEKMLMEEIDRRWKEAGGPDTLAVNVDFAENAATVDFIIAVKNDHPMADLLRSGITSFRSAFVEQTFGQFIVNSRVLQEKDFRSYSVNTDPKEGLIEAHLLATIPVLAGKGESIYFFRDHDREYPKPISALATVKFKGRSLTSFEPDPAEKSEDTIKFNNASGDLDSFYVATEAFESETTALSNFLSRQALLQKVGTKLYIPILGSLLNGILEVLPLLIFLGLLWLHRGPLPRPLVILAEIILALLAFHFALRLAGAIDDLYSLSFGFFVEHSRGIARYIDDSRFYDLYNLMTDQSISSFGFTNVGTILLGVLIPALFLRRSGSWDAQDREQMQVNDPLAPATRPKTDKRRISVVAIITYAIILLMIGASVYYLNLAGSDYVVEEHLAYLSMAGVVIAILSLILMGVSGFLYAKLDGRPVPAVVVPLVFWVTFLGNLILSFIVGVQLTMREATFSSRASFYVQVGWVWLVYTTFVGAALVYAMLRIIHSLLKQAGIVQPLERRTRYLMIVIAILAAIPMNALYDPSSPAASYHEVWNLAVQLDDLIRFIFLAGLIWYFFEEGRQSAGLSQLTLTLGLLAMATVFYPSNVHWLFIPLTFLLGYRLLSGSLHPASYWEELQPMESRVFGERLNLLEQIVYLNTGERGYQELYKTLSAKLGKNEISYTKFLEEMNARRKELDENNEMAKVCGKPVKDVALTFGPKQTAWENGRHGAFWALLFSLPWMAIWLFNFMTGRAATTSYPLWAFLTDLLTLLISWVGIGFLFGYFYPFLRGKDGLQKGFWLWFLIVLPALPLALINNSSPTSWQGFLFWILQVFIHCMLLGLIAFDYMTLRQGYRDWQMLFELHGIPSVGVSVSTILIAAGTAITTLFQSQAQEMVKAALTFIIPSASQLFR